MSRTKSIPNPYARKIVVALKVNADEMGSIMALAHRYTDGNVSLLVREAALSYRGKKTQSLPPTKSKK